MIEKLKRNLKLNYLKNNNKKHNKISRLKILKKVKITKMLIKIIKI